MVILGTSGGSLEYRETSQNFYSDRMVLIDRIEGNGALTQRHSLIAALGTASVGGSSFLSSS